MSINVTLRRLDFPEWVNDAYKELSPGKPGVEDIVKSLIYSQITPLENGDFEISKLLQDGANRVPILEDLDHCLWALEMSMVSLAWSKMDERGEVKIKEEEIERKEE